MRINSRLRRRAPGRTQAAGLLFIRINIIDAQRKKSLVQGQLGRKCTQPRRVAYMGWHTLQIRMNSTGALAQGRPHTNWRTDRWEFMRICSTAARGKLARRRRAAGKCENPPRMRTHDGGFMRINSFSHGRQVSRPPELSPARVRAPRPPCPAGFPAPWQMQGACRLARQSTPRKHRPVACSSRWST